ncbi:hypothetical protein CFOL_v3_12825 [Cephalotus follicularis]|uniref:Glycine-rich protein n=1 Tax=Cephalotus follicularis TaxID=3775 RepID=A0A1Q3BN79_CEPFO|nr:hypothetical protein CFOL_v3_12825 [Cephalotus follicularis]
MAATPASEASDGPVLSLINKRIRNLRKKLNRIIQLEESVAQGKSINKEQEDLLRSKPYLPALIDELEKLRQPLSAAVSDEIDLFIECHQAPNDTLSENPQSSAGTVSSFNGAPVEDLLNLLYFGSLFDVKTQSDFAATMWTRTHERGCCLTYDYVTDDATDLLGETDLDLISRLGGFLVSRPIDSTLSHKNALHRCIDHAKLWLANSDNPIEPDSNVTYAGLRERLNKIMASDYFTTTPMKAPVEVAAAAAAAAGNYAPFQVPVHGSDAPISVPVQVDGLVAQYQQKDEDAKNLEHENGDSQLSSPEEYQKNELETENLVEVVSVQQEQVRPQAEMDLNQGEVEHKEQQYSSQRPYQNQRGGRGGGGGGRKSYYNGRAGRSSGRGGYQNGRSLYYDQPGNFYPRNYNNNRGRGGRGSGHPYNNHGSAVQGGHAPADIGVSS